MGRGGRHSGVHERVRPQQDRRWYRPRCPGTYTLAAITNETVNGRRGTYANTGDWITDHTYLLYEKGKLEIKRFKP